MMKFFRKHMKEMLAIFMAALLIIWVGGDALTSALSRSAQQSDRTVGTLYGEEVTNEEFGRFSIGVVQVLDSLYVNPYGVPWRRALTMGIREDELSPMESYMLYQEAARNRISVAQANVERLYAMQPAALIDNVRERHRCSIQQIKDALGVYLTIVESFSQASIGASPSEADINQTIGKTARKVDVRLVSISPMAFFNNTYEPSEEEIQAQFEKYRDKPRGRVPGDFGYQMPEKTQVEYITASAEVLSAAQEITDHDARIYWQDHKDEFLAPMPPVDPDTPPEARPKPQPYETFTEAKPEVLEKMRTEQAEGEALRIANEAIGTLKLPWANTGKTDEGYNRIPEVAKSEDRYPELIDRMDDQYPGVLSYGRTKMFDQSSIWSEASELAGTVARAGTPEQVRFSQAAFWVAGLDADIADAGDNKRFYRNLYETCVEPFVDRQTGDAHVFRNIKIQPAHPAESLDEPLQVDDQGKVIRTVRDEVIRDIRFQLAQEEAERQAQQLFERAQKVGLEEAFNSDEALKEQLRATALRDPLPFPQRELTTTQQGAIRITPPQITELGGPDEGFVDLCFADPDAEGHYVRLHEQDRYGRKQWIVVERKAFIPIQEDVYEKQRDDVITYLSRESQNTFRGEWFASDNIRQRVQWQEPPDREGQDGKPTDKDKKQNQGDGDAGPDGQPEES